MEFTSYQMVATNTASLNTASYLNRTEYSLFVNGFTSDLWYGFSANDVVELGVWDRDNNFIGWDVLNASKSFDKITLSYYNTLNFPVTYSYTELRSDFILYKNAKILVNPCEQLSSSLGILDGSYFLTYNFTREMAGTDRETLVIKDISPSRRELKLIPIGKADASYNAFCKKQVLLRDVSPLYLESLKNCPYGQIYGKISPLYQKEINTIKSVFFLNTDGAMVNFLRNLYEDLIIYSTTPRVTDIGVENRNEQIIRIQGIQTYFNNYLLSNSDNVVEFSDLDRNYSVFVTSSIERKFAPIGAHPPEEYVKAKAFVYDFFTKYFYNPVSEILSSTYKEKYFANFRNALNFGDNRLLPILIHGVMDERVSPDDPLTLLVKLESELPMDIAIQESCWVSNIAFSPYVVNAIIKNPSGNIVHTIGAPNFSIPIPNVSLTNTNMAYTSTDLEESNVDERELTVSRNLTELSVDYTDFQNFVIFSSAELRLKIFQNKVITLSTLSSSAQALTSKNNAFVSASGSIYPYYVQEYTSVQGQMTDIVNSFDGYESYLYRSGVYTYTNGTFVSSSYITELNNSASAYDRDNRDSLVNNCPKHIRDNSDSDDYIIFLSMIGHFFDGIYSYISNMPSERQVGHTATEAFTRRVVDYMLETFGWKMDDSLEYATLLNNYLSSEQQEGLNAMSAEDRLKEVRNRILINLPGIYKTKGTEESVRLILACYGIPSALLSIREYGGVNYTDDSAAYTTYERSFMYQWDTSSAHDYFRSNLVPNCKTYLLKFSADDSSIYTYGKEQIMLGVVSSSVSSQSAAGSGEWALGFTRVPGKNLGNIFFRVGHNDDIAFKMTSSAFPLFDGNVYSVMLRRNLTPEGFQYNSNTDAVPSTFDLYVQRNEFGNKILKLSSSYVSYDYGVNHRFSTCASGSYLMLGGWFTDHNGQGFVGTMDKLQVWYDSITDSNFEDYVNSINAYSFSGSRPAHQSLVLRMHTDYPFDVREEGVWRNANPFYAVSSSAKIESYLGEAITADMDMMTSVNAWSGSQILVETTCSNYSQSAYPFQFKVIDYPSTWGISKYGPNKFRNEKIRHISQSVEARFDDKARSTYDPGSNTAPDSNQVGFFVDPQDFRNKDIVRYFGNYDFMDAIGDPSNQYSSSYQSLNLFRKEYARAQNEYSGSKTLFNELITLHKLYFNRSIFEAIKNVVPARCNALVGVVIEPTILERPKYPIKPIFSEMNSGSVFYYDTTAAHYFRDPNTKLCRITESLIWTDFNIESGSLSGFDYTTLPDNKTMDLNVSYINLPTRVYPTNHIPLGNYFPDIADPYQLGHFGDGVELDPLIILPYQLPDPPTASFVGGPTHGPAPHTVQFTNLSTNAIGYSWTFGDGGTSFFEHPSYTYVNSGVYTVGLTVIGNIALGGVYDTKISSSMIVVSDDPIPPDPPVVCQTGYYNGSLLYNGSRYPTKYTISVGSAIGNASIICNTFNNVPCRFVVYFDSVKVADTGWKAADTVAYSYALGAYHAASAISPGVNQGVSFNAFGFGIINTPGKNITLTYAKNSATTTAEVWVYACHGDFANVIVGMPNVKFGVKWNFTSSCAT